MAGHELEVTCRSARVAARPLSPGAAVSGSSRALGTGFLLPGVGGARARRGDRGPRRLLGGAGAWRLGPGLLLGAAADGGGLGPWGRCLGGLGLRPVPQGTG